MRNDAGRGGHYRFNFWCSSKVSGVAFGRVRLVCAATGLQAKVDQARIAESKTSQGKTSQGERNNTTTVDQSHRCGCKTGGGRLAKHRRRCGLASRRRPSEPRAKEEAI